MPKAEAGSVKDLNKKMKLKGLQQLRLYCTACQKQCRDDNGFKMHCQSESHVRQLLIVGEDPKKFINDFSNQFSKAFLQLLKTGHGEKQVHINRFYQEYIADKEHVHLNATKWSSLTEFAKYLGREGICRVEETDKGLHISWIDNSPESVRRQEALRRKQAQDQGDEELEQRMIREQIRRAQASFDPRDKQTEDEETEGRELKRHEGEKITLSFGAKPTTTSSDGPTPATPSSTAQASQPPEASAEPSHDTDKAPAKPNAFGGVSLKLGGKPQTKNVFSQAKKKNALSSGAKKPTVEQPKRMSEAERIMKEEMERKRSRGPVGFGMPAAKKQRSN
ncbi:hypothetical protein G7046_g6028 [Stylonectria norvegica]|nr:hypothetical protein G7046_g6028 [Stylonectria norvegica]